MAKRHSYAVLDITDLRNLLKIAKLNSRTLYGKVIPRATVAIKFHGAGKGQLDMVTVNGVNYKKGGEN